MNLDIKKIKNAVHAFKACCSDDGLRVIELLHKYGTLNRNQIKQAFGQNHVGNLLYDNTIDNNGDNCQKNNISKRLLYAQ